MGPQFNLRAVRARAAMACALVIASISVTAAPLLAGAARAATAPAISVADSTLSYGEQVLVRGSVGTEDAGRTVALEFGSERTGWRVVATAAAGRDGGYVLRARLEHSGQVRVAVGEAAALRADSGADGAAVRRSSTRPVTVAAALPVPYRRLDVLAGRHALVKGVLRPGVEGRLVRLETLRGGSWRAVAHDRTDAAGRYVLPHRTRAPGSAHARVTFPGDAAHGRAVRQIGRINAYRSTTASRYDLYGGALACGGSLGYESLVVAHKTLPCGTKVTIRYRGRTVTATVRDRGPYAGGREYDLAGGVARRLGFNGVGAIWVTK